MDTRGWEMSPGCLRGRDIEGTIHVLECMLTHPVTDGRAVGRRPGFRMRSREDEVLVSLQCTVGVVHLGQEGSLARVALTLVTVAHLGQVEKEAVFLGAAI